MSESIKDERRTRHGFLFGVFLGAGLAAIVGTAIFAGAKVSAAPFGSIAALHGHRWGNGTADPEKAKERAEMVVSFVLGRVDATDEQQSKARQIVAQTIDDLVPLRETHQANRETLRSELTKPDFDPDAVERFRL
jgi:Spy/CpxP family protein refolding chaperone